MNPSPNYVKQDSCTRRHRFLAGTILTGVGLVIVVGGWAVTAGYTAEKRAGQVDARMNVHEARQEERDQALNDTLTDIKVMQERIFDTIVDGK